MSMKKKAAIPLFVIVIAVLLIGSAGVYVYNGGKIPYVQQLIYPSAGAKLIDSIEVINQHSYTCDADECIVSGMMDIQGTGKDTFICDTCTVSKTFSSVDECVSTASRCEVGTCTNRHCVESSVVSYDVKWNFCPLNDNYFVNCEGNNPTVEKSGEVYTNDNVKLSYGETINFNPKYVIDNSINVEYFKFIVDRYDKSCVSAPIDQPNKFCVSGKKYCTPKTVESSEKYCQQAGDTVNILKARCEQNCDTSCVLYSGADGAKDPDCPEIYGFNGISYSCITSERDYSHYLLCDSEDSVGETTCPSWGSDGVCDSGQVCILDSSGNVGTGVGSCGCVETCSEGSWKLIDYNKYQVCEVSTACPDFSQTKTCPPEMVVDIVNQKCVPDEDLVCNPITDNICINDDTQQKCIAYVFGAGSDFSVSSFKMGTSESCLGDEGCENGDCHCVLSDQCTKGEKQCTGDRSYNECTLDSNDPNSCLRFRDLGSECDISEKCSNGQCVARTDVGCSFKDNPTQAIYESDYKCSSITDLNSEFIEECINNECVEQDDDYSATESEYISGNDVCLNNNVYEIKQYTTRDNVIYRKELKETCSGSKNLCSNGQCVGSLEGYFFTCNSNQDCKFGVGQDIENITLTILKTDNSNFDGGTIIVTIRKGTTEYARGKAEFFSGATEAKVEWSTVKTMPIGNYQLIAVIDEYNTATQNITVQKGLLIDVVCPPVTITGRDIACTIKITDGSTNQVITSIDNIEAEVVQGDSVLESTVTSSTLTFTALEEIMGSVQINIDVSKEDYVSGSNTINVLVSDPVVTPSFSIDGTDFFSIVSGISSGLHELSLSFDESGESLELFDIVANIRTPSGQEVPITFTEKANNIWKSSYDFEQPGQTYKLSGEVQFSDINRDPKQFEYLIVVSSSIEEPYAQSINMAIILSVIGLILLVVFIISIAYITRKK